MRIATVLSCYRRTIIVVAGLLSACKATDVNRVDFPSGTQDPSTFNTQAGALDRYHTVVAVFELGWINMQIASGLLTDELYRNYFTNGGYNPGFSVDERTLTEGVANSETDQTYAMLQSVRTYAVQAQGSLVKYDSSAPLALRGAVYAMTGYAELMLADLFCSGVPLSQLEFEGEYQYHAGSTTVDVYQHAIAQFDSALSLASDSARIMNLARVGKGRAYLALGQYDSAAAAVHDVPDDYTFQFPVTFQYAGGGVCDVDIVTGICSPLVMYSVSDREGRNGLPFLSSGDPRMMATAGPCDIFSCFFSLKYGGPNTTTPVTVASGIEARLTTAELQLHSGNIAGWLTILNALRTNGTYTLFPNSVTPNIIDTVWNAGSGGVAGLRPLHDPGSDTARVSLLFAEREAWLFMTGTREGDLRRLIRQYGRSAAQLYPVGRYPSGNGYLYGADINAPIPQAERVANPLFAGCLNRRA